MKLTPGLFEVIPQPFRSYFNPSRRNEVWSILYCFECITFRSYSPSPLTTTTKQRIESENEGRDDIVIFVGRRNCKIWRKKIFFAIKTRSRFYYPSSCNCHKLKALNFFATIYNCHLILLTYFVSKFVQNSCLETEKKWQSI